MINGQRLLKIAQPLPPAPPPQIITDEFSPLITARCDRGIMYIQIVTQQPFYGVAHTRDYRKSQCMIIGDGSYNTTLKISLLAQPDDELYCGIQRFKVNIFFLIKLIKLLSFSHFNQGERSVGLAVRMHKSLELSEDRFFYLTCQNGYQNIRGGTYRVNLKLIDTNTEQRAVRLIHGQSYKLRAELSPKDSITTLRMKNCFVFTKSNDNVELIDRSGCPAITNLITPFYYNDSSTGEAYIAEMFKFPHDSKVHFQCDALLCRDNCVEPDCENIHSDKREYELDGYSHVSASTSVFIREPTDSDALIDANQSDVECTEWRFPWLITLCICLAIMLLVMLLLNLFMCSSLTCRCIKTDLNEKEPTDFDDYDPYRADWTAPNSLQGSRYSLQQARQQYPSDETLHSNNTSNPDYHHHDNKGFIPTTTTTNQQQPTKRSKRNVQPHQQQQSDNSSSISESDNESIDRHHHHNPHHHPYRNDYPIQQQQDSLRPIRTHDIDYSFDSQQQPQGYPKTHTKRF
uniref:Uncharacterized protein LOC113791176 isoform X3 n=1 Tax=Dermatophagoides pteronyssinus TaxID=6956 RepID=A0A6P6XV35_DERPT|nr:uncharacterized protein LOC113791176 isoform X3 [Dermatophagoides pteronyssinus]